MQRFFILIVTTVLFSCKPSSFFEASSTKTANQVILGSIGSEKDFLLQKHFNSSALPSYRKPIRVQAVKKQFNKQTYKAYQDAATLQSAKIPVTYIDSLPNKPKYLQLQIADKVTLIEALNSEENSGVQEYLDHNAHAQVLTRISIVLKEEDMQGMIDADAIFLTEKRSKNYVLEVHKAEGAIATIRLNQGIIFQYQVSNCCWQENARHDIEVADLVGTYTQCPKSTYRSSQRAKKRANHYKL
ncbi:hypothetical protein MHTCC0001_14760 [Flavobacteriaceae bacterium MHTCC 0001]